MEGLIEPALLITKAARDRYDGRQRSPWNEVECGDHYVRATSSWALLEVAAGYHYSAPDRRLRFAPRIEPEDFRCFFATESAWGSFSQRKEGRRQIAALSVEWGTLRARTFEFERVDPRRRLRRVDVRVAGRPVKATWEEEQGRVTVRLARTASVAAGKAVEVTLRGR